MLPLLALAVVAGVSAVWAALAVVLASNCAWMGLLAAADAAFLLRLSGQPGGPQRAWLCVVLTALTLVCATALVAAARFGTLLGLRPAESLDRLSPGLLTLFIGGNAGSAELVWALAALLLAWWLGR